MYETKEAEKSTRKKRYQPTDTDWEVNRVSFDEAENGVVVECNYQLKDDVKNRIKKDRDEGGPYVSEYRESTKHVFENKADAKTFVNDKLGMLWPNKGE